MLALLVVLVAAVTASASQPIRKPVPRRSVPATPAHAAPDTTAAIPSRAGPSAGAVDDDTLPPPFTLPKASRARMRACGETWEGMKQSGEAGDDIWRDFAVKCLAAKGSPVVKAAPLQAPMTRTDAKLKEGPAAASR